MSCGCQGHRSAEIEDPILPTIDAGTTGSVSTTSGSERSFIGLWQVTVPDDRQSIEVVPLRGLSMHLNAVKFLEDGPCYDCLSISLEEYEPPDYFRVKVSLSHPMHGNLKYTAFDVRGIFITNGDYLFPANERFVALGDDLPRMLNPDGYTSIFNPTEFPTDSPLLPILKYYPGDFGPQCNLTATLNPFKAELNYSHGRRPFTGAYGGIADLNMELQIPPTGGFQFGYAVDASWMFIDGEVTSINDFPMEANCPEAFEIGVKQWFPLRTMHNHSTTIDVGVWDHQGLETIDSVRLEAPDLFNGQVYMDYVEPGDDQFDDAWVYRGEIHNSLDAPNGLYPMLVTVEDKNADINLGPIDAHQVFQVRVSDGWLTTWGDDYFYKDWVTDVCYDNGRIYVCGKCRGDMIPGPDIEEKGMMAFLSCFNDDGELEWTHSWPATICQGIATDKYGFVYVTGQFRYQTDFDPGPDETEINPDGYYDIFLSKFNKYGNFQWVKTWGGKYDNPYGEIGPCECGMDVTIDEHNDVIVCGNFTGVVDFDPGPDVFELESTDSPGYGYDPFLSKFEGNGDFVWALTWGGANGGNGWTDTAFTVKACQPDIIYVQGFYEGTVDFDPGPGEEIRDGASPWCGYISKFIDNEFQWVDTWGPFVAVYRLGHSMDVDDFGDIYFSGTYGYYNTDLDPTEGEFYPDGTGGFVSKIMPDGNLLWTKLFRNQSVNSCYGLDLTTNGPDSVTVAGVYSGDVDFDPSDEVDLHQSQGYGWEYMAGFVCQLTREGNYEWAVSIGNVPYGQDHETCAIDSDEDGNLYFGGMYSSYYDDTGTDFDPGPLTYYRYEEYYGCQYLMMIPPNGIW